MKKQTKSNWQKQLVFAAIAVLVFMFAASSNIAAQGRYKVGERVECDFNGTGTYSKGAVAPFLNPDSYNGMRPETGKWYHVQIDGYGGGYEVICKVENMRPIAATNTRQNQKTEDKDNDPQQPNRNDERAEKDGNQNLKYKVGDRVECDITESGKFFEKGTIAPFPEGDKYNGYLPESGYYYRVKLDRRAAGGTVQIVSCKANDKTLRPLAGNTPYKPETTEIPIGDVTVDENNTLSADRPILDCPVKQPQARNAARPNAELLKKVLRCRLGEKPAEKGLDGAVTIDVTAIQIGAPRPWDRLRDMGGGTPGKTIVYPVKVTYTEKTFYRGQTIVGENWVRIFNFFVNGFGEWQYGSAETIKMPDNKNIPRDQ